MTTPTRPRARQGFTLVEMLVVIVIIGILAGLIVGAAVMVRPAVRRATIKTEISQLEIALERYKAEYGEYPPDFFGLQHNNTDIVEDAQRTVIKHLRKRFPRYPLPATHSAAWTMFRNDVLSATAAWDDSNSPLDVNRLDCASALVFWLGGLPDGVSGDMKPAGFNSDPTSPFRLGLPRTSPFFEFKVDRYVPIEQNPGNNALRRYLRFYPDGSTVAGNQNAVASFRQDQVPFVYFKSRRITVAGGRYEYAVSDFATNPSMVPACYVHGPTAMENVAVPYLDEYPGTKPYWSNSNSGPPASSSLVDLQKPEYIRRWRNLEKYQIVCAGLDAQFGNVTQNPGSGVDLYRFRFTKSGDNLTGLDLDNLTNFTQGTLEDEMQ
jgi:general secretion pathway protein G